MTNVLTPREVTWENIVFWTTRIGEFFMVLRPQSLWAAPFLAFIFTADFYMLYIFTSFAWFDMTIAMAISNVYYTVTGGTELYCIDAQMIGAFYATVVTHFVFNPHKFLGWLTTLPCIIGIIASIIIMEATSALSVAFGLAVGAAFGIIRILLFIDLTTTWIP